MADKASFEDVIRFDGTNERAFEEATELAELCNSHERLRLPLALRVPGEGFGYYQDEALVGYFELHPAGGPKMEGSGMVHPEFRRRGIGRALIEAVRADCRARGRPDFLFANDEAGAAGRPFASAIGAAYEMSEHLLELDAAQRPPPYEGPLSIRVAGLDDVDDVVRIGMRAFGGDEKGTELRRRRTLEWMSEPLRVIYLAMFEGRPVGTATLFLVPDSAVGFINALAVLPECQGRGFGRQILSEAVDGLVLRKRPSVNIEVQTDNDRALGIYESVGFERKTTYAYFRVKAGQAEHIDASAV